MPLLQPLIEKYHPDAINDFIGLDKNKKLLTKFLANPYSSSWLFSGPPGTGKTSMALAMERELTKNKTWPLASQNHLHGSQCNIARLDSLRGDLDLLMYSKFNQEYKDGGYVFTPRTPEESQWLFVIVDEADEMTNAAYIEALSLMPPSAPAEGKNFICVFTCNSTDKLEPRFISRCRHLQFSTYGMLDGIVARLADIWEKEAPGAPPPNFAQLVKDSRNNVRDVFSALEIELLSL